MRMARKVLTLYVFGVFWCGSFPALAGDPAGPAAHDEHGEWQKMRDTYDTDKDGKLSPTERQAMMRDRREAIVKKYDKNKNGRLELKERKAWAVDQRVAIFQRLDTNSDKRISSREADKARGPRGRMLSRGFHRLDRDQDGAISIAEMERALVRRPLPGNRPAGRFGAGGPPRGKEAVK